MSVDVSSNPLTDLAPHAPAVCRAFRHIYLPLMRHRFSKFSAAVAVFFLSAFLHEYLVAAPLRLLRVWAFLGMMAQVRAGRGGAGRGRRSAVGRGVVAELACQQREGWISIADSIFCVECLFTIP